MIPPLAASLTPLLPVRLGRSMWQNENVEKLFREWSEKEWMRKERQREERGLNSELILVLVAAALRDP